MTEDDDDARHTRTNWIVLGVAVVLVVLGVLLMRWLAYETKLSDCVAAGHRDCEPIEQPQSQ